MSIIKLNATSSTNDYLKTLSKNQSLKNYTVVLADEQTNGRGQMGTTWSSEKGKNLIMSILIKNVMSDIQHIFYLNMAVSLSVVQVLESLKLENIAIKWPNDIMAGNKKIAGILIENTIKPDNCIDTIIGIGLNVNQDNFNNLPKATSLYCYCGKTFNIEEICKQIIAVLQNNVSKLLENHTFQKEYHQYLYRKDIPSVFSVNNSQFMGIIVGVNSEGKLQIKDETDTVTNYSLKEVALLS